MSNANMEGAQKKVERLKKIGKNKNVIKSPYYNDPTTNPCIKEQNQSRKCWLDSDFDAEACKDHYDNYKICMKFWNRIEWERRLTGVRPALPPPEERPGIIKERMRAFQNDDSKVFGLHSTIN